MHICLNEVVVFMHLIANAEILYLITPSIKKGFLKIKLRFYAEFTPLYK